MRLHCFAPVVDKKVQVLVLGSFPGVESLRKKQYYSFGHNQFWKLLGTALGEDISSMAYDQRLKVLLNHHVGLWDVIASCERAGSLDGNIKGATYNDFSLLKLPQLRLVCGNGQKAYAAAQKLIADVRIVRLPSSSPACTMALEQKAIIWKETLQSLYVE